MFSFPLSVDGYCLFKRKIKLRWEAAFVTNSFAEYLKSLTVDKINNRRIHLMQHIEILMCSYIQLFNVKKIAVFRFLCLKYTIKIQNIVSWVLRFHIIQFEMSSTPSHYLCSLLFLSLSLSLSLLLFLWNITLKLI